MDDEKIKDFWFPCKPLNHGDPEDIDPDDKKLRRKNRKLTVPKRKEASKASDNNPVNNGPVHQQDKPKGRWAEVKSRGKSGNLETNSIFIPPGTARMYRRPK